MLTLLEPPGGKQHQRFRSGQFLLNLGGGAANDEEEYDYEDYQAANGSKDSSEESAGCLEGVAQFLDSRLVGKSSSDEYSERWKKEFRQRPSWCDADLCLQQIKRKRAKGNKWALYSRSFIQKCLFSLGTFVQENAWSVIVAMLILFSFCCYGLQFVRIETDIVKLWVAKGGRLDEELTFHARVLASVSFNESEQASEVVRENGLGGGYQVVIQTPESEDYNVLSKEGLLRHVGIMQEIANIEVAINGSKWTLSDLCFKPAKPEVKGDAEDYEAVIERIIPCIWITPIDCFWEGSKPLGPHPALVKKNLSKMNFLDAVSKIQGLEVSWQNLNPERLVRDINELYSLGSYALMFERAGIGAGYLDRPCMDPLDPKCPKESPNYFETCKSGLVDRWMAFMKENNETFLVDDIEEYGIGMDELISLFGGGDKRKKREAVDDSLQLEKEVQKALEGQRATKAEETASSSLPPSSTPVPSLPSPSPSAAPAMSKEKRRVYCMNRHGPMLRWMAVEENKEKWSQFLQESEFPRYPDYAKVMNKGCGGFARGVLQWPEDMIIGGAQKNEEGDLVSAQALQSVFLVASPNDIYLRFKGKSGERKEGLAAANWTKEMAEQVIITWQRNFTQMLYKHRLNFVNDSDGFGSERRTIHPLASTSIADMLEEFCQFNYTIILVGYGLMLIYAMVTQLRTDRCLPAAHSCMGLAFAGVLTVTFASVAGLGLATWFGIEFNAATTQIVPFLTLGIGVDNMFMLLHNYHDVVAMTRHHEMGVLMRETGMSILCTSTNNILSFLAGTLLPIPALRSFCAQSTILLSFNFLAILTIYPAVMAIDLRRRKAGRRDLLCCLQSAPPMQENYSMIEKPTLQARKTIGEQTYTNLMKASGKEVEEPEDIGPRGFLHAAIRNYYIPLISNSLVKGLVIAASLGLCFFAVMGMQRANIGLELSDVLPEHTAPAAFLKARDAYFSFYPMFAVLKGNSIDYAKQQQLIDNYRTAIGKSRFVIKTDGKPSEPYWLGMMKDWLLSIQNATQLAIAKGLIDVDSGEVVTKGAKPGQTGIIEGISEDALTGYRLMCSFGNNYVCKGRVGTVELVDRVGIINIDGFYNYLTAWFNQDNMMYYVTQASFYPNPPAWKLDFNETNLVPPASPLAYSQIPFYLTGLTNTPVIVEAIKEIRAICDNFTAEGLPNFPQGIAFTFWEQYLHLNANLFQAIMTIALAVFVVLSLLLFSPWAAASILAILICMTIQLAGFLGWAGIKMNPVSAVTLITAVGIGVEFTAHVVLAFLTSLGSRQDRMAAAVDRVFVPVIHGALSTLLGIIMLAFSEFEFVVKYFFVVMSALIVIGLINGLILLPVLLSLVGPRTEILPLDNKRKLPLPPAIRKTTHNIAEADEDDDGQGLTMYPRRV